MALVWFRCVGGSVDGYRIAMSYFRWLWGGLEWLWGGYGMHQIVMRWFNGYRIAKGCFRWLWGG